MTHTNSTPANPAQGVTPNFSDTLNFYISAAEDGICSIPRQKLIEVQEELRALEAAAIGATGQAVTVKALIEEWAAGWQQCGCTDAGCGGRHEERNAVLDDVSETLLPAILSALAHPAPTGQAVASQGAVSEAMVEVGAQALYEVKPFHGLDNRPNPIPWAEYASANPSLADTLRKQSRAALTAALQGQSERGVAAVAVKPLEWSDERGSYADFKFGPDTIYYSVDLVVENLDLWSVDTGVIGSDFGRTEIHKCVGREAAKAAAQADYERRIRSALVASPTPQPDGWREKPPTYHRYPHKVENIAGEWHLVKQHGNGSSHTISKHSTASEAMLAAAPLAPGGA